MSLRSIGLTLLAVFAALSHLTMAAGADTPFGPSRTELFRLDWGGVYHLPLPSTTVISRDLLGEWVFRDRGGNLTVVNLVGHSDGAMVMYPDARALRVTKSEDGEIEIFLRGVKASYRTNPDGWRMRLPNDDVRLQRRGKQVKISGRLGTTVVVDEPNGFTITSPSGETRYGRASFDEPYRLEGVPVQSHPYVVRGVWFESQGFGAFIDFKMADFSRAFTLLGWQPMLTVEAP